MLYFEDKKSFQKFAKETDNSIRADWNMASHAVWDDTINRWRWERFVPSCAIVIEGVHSENIELNKWIDDGEITFNGQWECDFWDCEYKEYWGSGTYIFFEKVEDAVVFKLFYSDK